MTEAKPFTDEILLQFLCDGSLKVPTLDNPEIILNQGKEITCCKHSGRDYSRYSFRIRRKGFKRRRVCRNKLVWMAGAKKVLPEGFEIHHVDEDPTNDCWSNLVAVFAFDHSKFHINEEPPF